MQWFQMPRLPVLLIVLGVTSVAGASRALAQWGWGYGPSTAAESYQRGAADLTRSAGMYNLSTAMAAISAEQARAMDIQNRLKATEAYFEMRKLNQSYRAAESDARNKNKNAEGAFRYGHTSLVKRLTIAKLDPVTGKLDWPKVLERDKYAPYRETLDRLFVHRAVTPGGLMGESYAEAANTCTALQEQLKQDLPEYSPTDWVEAKNFVESLAYESRFPAG